MNTKYIENGLALVAALIVLIGMSMAVNSALAAAPDLDIEDQDRISISVVEAG